MRLSDEKKSDRHLDQVVKNDKANDGGELSKQEFENDNCQVCLTNGCDAQKDVYII